MPHFVEEELEFKTDELLCVPLDEELKATVEDELSVEFELSLEELLSSLSDDELITMKLELLFPSTSLLLDDSSHQSLELLLGATLELLGTRELLLGAIILELLLGSSLDVEETVISLEDDTYISDELELLCTTEGQLLLSSPPPGQVVTEPTSKHCCVEG